MKAATTIGGSSIADLNKKNTSSISSLQKVCFVVIKKIYFTFSLKISGSISGSLMSLGKKERKNIKKIVKSSMLIHFSHFYAESKQKRVEQSLTKLIV